MTTLSVTVNCDHPFFSICVAHHSAPSTVFTHQSNHLNQSQKFLQLTSTPVSLVNSVFTITPSIFHPLISLCKIFNHTSQSLSFSFYNHAVNHTRSQFSHIHEITVFLRSSSGTYLDMGGKYLNSHLQVPTLICGKSI